MVFMKIKAGRLRKILEILSSLVDEAKIKFTKEGLHSEVVNPAHTEMIVMDFKKEGFEEYIVVEPIEIGIDVEKFLKTLKDKIIFDEAINIKDDEIITLSYDKVEEHALCMNIGRIINKIKLIDTASFKKVQIPNLKYNAMVVIENIDIVTNIQRLIAMLQEALWLKFSMNEKEFVISLKDDPDNIKLEIQKFEFKEFKIGIVDDKRKEVESKYPFEYLKNIWNPITELPVTFMFDTDLPFCLKYFFADGHGTVEDLLAPRVESD